MDILIVEDERVTAEALSRMITDIRPDADILAKLRSVESSVEWLETHTEPDLIFCDIHLSDGNSFEIFKKVKVDCPIIFSTAYNQYAIEAFQVNSIDYLLKPLDKKEVAKALKKYEALYLERNKLDSVNLGELMRQMQDSGSPQYKSRLMGKIGDTLKSISVDDVAYFYMEEGEVVMTTFEGQRYFPSYNLEQLEEQLEPGKFFRANRQIIVNIDAVKEVKPYFKGRLLLYVTPKMEERLVVSSGKTNAFKDWLER